jgi:uncharacterized membrane protein
VLGVFLALCSAATFALNNTFARRGVLTGSATQALSISVPLGLPMFFVGALAMSSLYWLGEFSWRAYGFLALAGIVHFVWGRFFNYRAVKAIGSNLAGPLQESSVLIALALAVLVLGESLTPLKVAGIFLVLLGPALAVQLGDKKKPAALDESAAEKKTKPAFTPLYAQGYLFAGLSALGYGASPILVRSALENATPGASLAGGIISYGAASLVVLIVIVATGQIADVRKVSASNAKWFCAAGFMVGLSQMLRYLALSMAPVSVIAPIQRLSLLFRMLFSWLINREHEVFSARLLGGTLVSLVGALLLSVSTDVVAELLPLPEWLLKIAAMSWSFGR